MTKEKPLKSAFELAMERLAAEDSAKGVQRARPLTDAEKREIRRLRDEAQAKLAEIEILHRDRMAAAAGAPEKLTELEEHYEVDRRRVESSLQDAIARIKKRAKQEG